MVSQARHYKRGPMIAVIVAVASLLWPASVGAQTGQVPPWRAALASPPSEATIAVGQTALQVQLAVTPDQQSLGLGYRNELAPGTGMLFVFNVPSMQTFWMKGMRFCLDIVWVSSMEVVAAAENACPDPAGTPDADRPIQTSPEPVQYVLEVPAGWLKSHGYGAGTPVNLAAVPATAAA